MQRIRPRVLSGFPELLPKDQILFNEMLDKIRSVYERFGFIPIETPAIELSEILLAKGGGDTEKQIYRFTKGDNDIALHFDLTIPLARYVAEHYGELTFPFRRYQLQKVWRAERPQKGRFREFYQCDIDVIGSTNPLIDAEIAAVVYSVFKTLGFDKFTIHINNRKILSGFLESIGITTRSTEVLRTIDKLEKQGKEAVVKQMSELGMSKDKITSIFDFIEINGTNEEVLAHLDILAIKNASFEEGMKELHAVYDGIAMFGVPSNHFSIDLTIARGLDYYTGTVYETILDDYPGIGSVCSGGRFDDLASYYIDKKLPGVGVSIGLTRLFHKLKEAKLLEAKRCTSSYVLVAQIDPNFLDKCLNIATTLRENGINTEVYFEQEKIGKQFKYANKLGIPFVIVIGEQEVKDNKVTIKNMLTGEQTTLPLDKAIVHIKQTGRQFSS